MPLELNTRKLKQGCLNLYASQAEGYKTKTVKQWCTIGRMLIEGKVMPEFI